MLSFDLIALASQASYVLYSTTFSESNIARKKNGREFLYQLGIELVMPEILRRRRSNSFRYLSKDLRHYIDSLLKKNCVSRTDEVIFATIPE